MTTRSAILAWPAGSNENEYTQLLYRALTEQGIDVLPLTVRNSLKFGPPLAVHIHWPDSILATRNVGRLWLKIGWLTLILLIAKARTVTTLWTVHNLRPHETRSALASKILYRLLRSTITAWCFLTYAGRHLAVAEHPWLSNRESCYTPHGLYTAVMPEPVRRIEAIGTLGLRAKDDLRVLVLGQIRGYKGTRRVSEMADPQRGMITVAGRPRGDVQLGELVAPGIMVLPEFIPSVGVRDWVCAADLIVVTTPNVYNTGIPFLALTYGTPVLTISNSVTEEMAARFPNHWRTVSCLASEAVWDLAQQSRQDASRSSPFDSSWETSARNLRELVSHSTSIARAHNYGGAPV